MTFYYGTQRGQRPRTQRGPSNVVYVCMPVCVCVYLDRTHLVCKLKTQKFVDKRVYTQELAAGSSSSRSRNRTCLTDG